MPPDRTQTAGSNLRNGTSDPVRTHRCHVAICRDADDLVSVLVLNLPGTGSSGPTEAEAVDRCREAVAGVIEHHRRSGEPVPWRTPDEEDEVPPGSRIDWILVDA